MDAKLLGILRSIVDRYTFSDVHLFLGTKRLYFDPRYSGGFSLVGFFPPGYGEADIERFTESHPRELFRHGSSLRLTRIAQSDLALELRDDVPVRPVVGYEPRFYREGRGLGDHNFLLVGESGDEVVFDPSFGYVGPLDAEVEYAGQPRGHYKVIPGRPDFNILANQDLFTGNRGAIDLYLRDESEGGDLLRLGLQFPKDTGLEPFRLDASRPELLLAVYGPGEDEGEIMFGFARLLASTEQIAVKGAMLTSDGNLTYAKIYKSVVDKMQQLLKASESKGLLR